LHCKEAQEGWEYATENQNGLSLLTGFGYSVSADRKRASVREFANPLGKKPVSTAQTAWKRTTLWAR